MGRKRIAGSAIEEQILELMEELGISYFPTKAELYGAKCSGLYGRISRSGGIQKWARRMDLPTWTESIGKGSSNPRRKAPSICWNCLHAVPNPEKGIGCEWSMYFRPVPGWEVEIRILPHIGKTPNVRKCPKFKRG